jgi:hypothetical protein
MKNKNLLHVIGVTCISLFFILASYTSNAQNMNVNPDKINLNAQGNAENLQCAYSFLLPSGYSPSTQDIHIYFAGAYVTDSYNVDYCVTDAMLFVQFDWSTVISSPVLVELVNCGPVVVTITGCFTASNNNGEIIEYGVDRWGYAEVIKPGKKR